MATAATKTARRARPEDGGIVWHAELYAFECYGCGDFEEIHRAADRTPDRLAELRELAVVDHTECWEFDDPRMARQARRHRKEKKRRENLSPQRRGPVAGDPGENLAAQRVSWRGRR